MFKYLLIFTFILSACTRQIVPTEKVMHDTERSKYIVYNILGPFLIDGERSPLTKPLIGIQASCEGQDFIGYRKCFTAGISEIQESLVHNSQEQQFFQIFGNTLQQEMEYYPYYQEIDDMNYPQDISYSIQQDCHIVSKGEFRSEYMGIISERSMPITISYNENDKGSLVKAFPGWSGTTIYDTKSFTGYGYDPNNPCLSRTFGPGYGNIIYTKTVGDDLYIFIKVNEGAGSGEFYYSVYVHNFITRAHKHIGGFWAWSGIFPFSYNLNLEKQQKSILTEYRNRPFFYYQILENKRIHGDTVESLYLKSTKK